MSESSFKEKASDLVQQFIEDKRASNIKEVHDQICDQFVDLPTLDEILETTRINALNWSPSLPKATDQSDESYLEQCTALEIGVKKIKKINLM